jgi:small GTP-binding protein
VVDVFDDKYIATLGTKVSRRDVEYKLPEKTLYLSLMIWDILGQKDYKKLRTRGLTGAHGIILVSDLARPDTIVSADDFWLPEALDIAGSVPVILIGNKLDIVGDDTAASDSLKDISEKLEIPLFLCSAKTGNNVEAAFRRLGELMLATEFEGRKTASEPTAESLAQAMDEIINDFCEQYGDVPKAMDIVDREFARAKVNVQTPVKDSLLMAIEYLSDIERDVHGRDVSEVNKLRRWKMIDEAR